MSVIILPTGNIGPFKSIEVLADRLRADNTDYPFTVIGSYTISADNSLAPPPPAPDPQIIQDSIVAATQSRLDTFAQTRNYDGILSAATYASSSVPKFAAEGQYAVNARDNTWETLYTILAEVTAGTRPMPTGYADIEPLLPPLNWGSI